MTQPADILLSLLREDRGSVPEVIFAQHDCVDKPKSMNAGLTVVDMNPRTCSSDCQAEQCNGGHDTSFVIASTLILFDPLPC